MAARQCPTCLTKSPAGCVLAYSDGMDCPGCKARLEVSFASRFLATLVGLLAATLVWRVVNPASLSLGWVLPMVYAILTFGVAAPLALVFIADLRLKPAEPSPEAVSVAHGGHD